ncbi:MAG TPA: type 2 isopentenyl-diphosphate Delta-isomerase, partial [Polyangiales bacterium]|nr:type 2 isopentenyl-diphosphate Delta-isomerase [Polyangiales bacterium]
MTDIRQRKADHLALCATDEVAFRSRTTLLECVEFLHDSLPELALSELDMSVQLFGKRLRAPLLIAAMTGGTEEAGEVNHTLAKIADRRGYAFGLGSQRAMQRAPDTAWTYDVRKVAPQVLLLGNVGVVQAREQTSQTLDKLVRDIGADALCVHMNPAMEVIQPEGDDDFRGGLETFARVRRDLSVPVIAKETGNGISPRTAHRLREVGVGHIDVSGAGGTSWVGVETLRAEGAAREVGQLFWDWGVPTAASVVYAKR